jgi:osmotically-inducible protein OsmY
LRLAVRQALARDIAVDSSPVSVRAEDGVIVLAGRVSSSAQKYAAEDVAWWTPGVTDVISHLEVDGAVEPPDEPDY